MTQNFYFTKKSRLRTKEDFSHIHQHAKKIHSYSFIGLFCPNSLGHNRLGFAVGKKMGNSPQRNRIKRIFRESFRLQQHQFPQGYDVLLIPKQGQYFSIPEIKSQLLWLFRKIQHG
ncbi:MAG: ribonuclease P protein component [Planctomycetota bacterium]